MSFLFFFVFYTASLLCSCSLIPFLLPGSFRIVVYVIVIPILSYYLPNLLLFYCFYSCFPTVLLLLSHCFLFDVLLFSHCCRIAFLLLYLFLTFAFLLVSFCAIAGLLLYCALLAFLLTSYCFRFF